MNTGTLEVRYRDTVLEITPDWFEISDVDDGYKYACETKYAYPDNMLPLKHSGKANIWTENLDCWVKYLTFRDIWVNEEFLNLIAEYTWGGIEEYIEKFSKIFKDLNIDVKYTK